MALSVKDYAGRARSSVWERELACELRQQPEMERLEFIREFAVVNLVVAMSLAKKCLREKSSFETLLDQAMMTSNPSSLQYWLDAIVPHVGFRRLVSWLRQRASTNADQVARAAYYLPNFKSLPGYSSEAVRSILN
jgi:hypothetical protein